MFGPTATLRLNPARQKAATERLESTTNRWLNPAIPPPHNFANPTPESIAISTFLFCKSDA
jgi:hypothetical protein